MATFLGAEDVKGGLTGLVGECVSRFLLSSSSRKIRYLRCMYYLLSILDIQHTTYIHVCVPFHGYLDTNLLTRSLLRREKDIFFGK